jgi:hypothetical protein
MPLNAALAVLSALLVYPGLRLLDRAQNCGDGLCGFIPGLLLMGVLLAATIIFTRRGLKRGETPGWLFLAPPAIWLFTFYVLAL